MKTEQPYIFRLLEEARALAFAVPTPGAWTWDQAASLIRRTWTYCPDDARLMGAALQKPLGRLCITYDTKLRMASCEWPAVATLGNGSKPRISALETSAAAYEFGFEWAYRIDGKYRSSPYPPPEW